MPTLLIPLALFAPPTLAYLLARYIASAEAYRYDLVQDCKRLTLLIDAGRAAGRSVAYFVSRRAILMRERDWR